MNENVDVAAEKAQPEQLSGVFSPGPPIQIQWPQPNGLKLSANLQYDWIELYLTPVSI